jgi:hypothetical protein
MAVEESNREGASTMLDRGILSRIADTGSTSTENSSAWGEPFAPDNCEPRSKNALQPPV